jgi:hypothetical protein
LEFTIYRKPTVTSTVIHDSSCHPVEHKKTAFNYLLNRAEKYPLSSTNKKTELNIIKQIARENEYDISILNNKTRNKHGINLLDDPPAVNTQNDTKWATFTYIGKETKHITKLFKDTGMRVAYRTNNSIKRILKPKNPIEQSNKYNSPGVYKLKCKDCPLHYIGQTGRSFATRYKEHIWAIKYNRETSGYARHILNTGHSYGKMDDIMDVIKIERKGKHLDTLEKFHIFCSLKQNLHLNDLNLDSNNPIFNVVYKPNGSSTHKHHIDLVDHVT